MYGVITKCVLFLLILISSQLSQAIEVEIVEVRKNLKLRNSEPVYRDYYLNAGTENGLKPNMTFTVYRKSSINDVFQSSSQGGTILIPMGKIKVLHSQTKLSIGRLLSLNSTKDSPVVDVKGFMVGDYIDLGSVEMVKNNEGKKKSKKSAKSDLPKKEESKQESNFNLAEPYYRVDVSRSVPVEILNNGNRSPASVNEQKPVNSILR